MQTWFEIQSQDLIFHKKINISRLKSRKNDLFPQRKSQIRSKTQKLSSVRESDRVAKDRGEMGVDLHWESIESEVKDREDAYRGEIEMGIEGGQNLGRRKKTKPFSLDRFVAVAALGVAVN